MPLRQVAQLIEDQTIDASQMSEHFAEVVRDLGADLLQTIRFHDPRHAHASIGITAELYHHVAQDLDADAAARAQQVLRRARV